MAAQTQEIRPPVTEGQPQKTGEPEWEWGGEGPSWIAVPGRGPGCGVRQLRGAAAFARITRNSLSHAPRRPSRAPSAADKSASCFPKKMGTSHKNNHTFRQKKKKINLPASEPTWPAVHPPRRARARCAAPDSQPAGAPSSQAFASVARPVPRGRIPVRPSQHLAALLCNIRAVRAPFLPAPNARPFPPRATPQAARPCSHIAMRLVRPPRAFALPRQGTAPRPHLTCALSCSGLPSLLDSVFLDLAGWAPVVLAARATPPAP